jgi:hypothetical protein
MIKRPQPIGLVACSRSKLDRAAPARELYISPLFRLARCYAERYYGHGHWFILSALHGLVDPETRVEPYDLCLQQLSSAERSVWGRRVARDLRDRFGATTIVLHLHAGAAYRDSIVGAVPHTVEAPLIGLRIGEQLAWYRRRLQVDGPH